MAECCETILVKVYPKSCGEAKAFLATLLMLKIPHTVKYDEKTVPYILGGKELGNLVTTYRRQLNMTVHRDAGVEYVTNS